MDPARVDFDSIEWVQMLPGARHKVVERGGKRLRLVEFASAFVEHDWCMKGHTGRVIEGDLELEFEDRTVRFNAGDGLMIRGGGVDKHKAKVLGSGVRMLFVEDV